MSKPLWVFVQAQEGRVSLTQPHMYMSGGWVRVDVRDVARLKARLADRERRIRLAGELLRGSIRRDVQDVLDLRRLSSELTGGT